jgi:TetR/AcrR family transcriptional repressor of mexJK operon
VSATAQLLNEENECCKPARGRPRSDAKNIAILEAAAALFMENGFDGTSMDEVARRAGVSKQTVYSHFSGKEQLFSAAVHQKVDEHFPEDAFASIENRSLETNLFHVSKMYCALMVSDDAMNMFRLLVSAAPKGPTLANIFWQAGPEEMLGKLKSFLQVYVDRGELVIEDMDRSAKQLISLLKGSIHFELSIGLIDQVDEATVDEQVKQSVEAFLKLHRPA